MKPRRAFTMVEVLVAITILVILAAILTPVLSRSVLAAKEAKGIEHLRQIHQIHMLYQADHGGGGTSIGGSAELGLPPWPVWPSRDGNDWYAAAPYGMTKELHKAPCGMRVVPVGTGTSHDDRILITTHDNYLRYWTPVYTEQTPIAYHWHCTPALRSDQFRLKRSSAVMLSGAAITKTGYSDYLRPSFYATSE